LIDALEQCARNLSGLQIINEDVLSIIPHRQTASVNFKDGTILRGSLVIGADGRNSVCRSAAEINTDERAYPQVALTVCLRHSRPHHDTSTEFHTPTGPFTLVPLPMNRSSLVWVLDPATADEFAAFADAKLADEIEWASYSILGKIEVESGRGLFPLRVATARRFADKRIALAGEAAHMVPPIGAQGLNLGLRDAATISELAIAACRKRQDFGGVDVLARYEKMRRADVGSRTLAVDWLNRTLLSDLLPAQGIRGLGLYLIDRIGPLRRAVMREGVGPASAQPRLMRGEAL
jgi:2-octaprenyl-6-methoxyphenol hydroxylase